MLRNKNEVKIEFIACHSMGRVVRRADLDLNYFPHLPDIHSFSKHPILLFYSVCYNYKFLMVIISNRIYFVSKKMLSMFTVIFFLPSTTTGMV